MSETGKGGDAYLDQVVAQQAGLIAQLTAVVGGLREVPGDVRPRP